MEDVISLSMWQGGLWSDDQGEIVPVRGLGKNLLIAVEGCGWGTALRKPTAREGQAALSILDVNYYINISWLGQPVMPFQQVPGRTVCQAWSQGLPDVLSWYIFSLFCKSIIQLWFSIQKTWQGTKKEIKTPNCSTKEKCNLYANYVKYNTAD